MEEYLTRQEKKQKQFKKIGSWIVGAALIAAAGYGVFWLSKSGNGETLNDLNINANDLVVGDANAPITVTEYSDFQCPACAAMYPKIHQMLIDFPGKVKLVYKHFPLREIHKTAEISARAGQAADEQGMFPEMMDMLFQHQSEWADTWDAKNRMIEYATAIGMDKARFEQVMNSKAVVNKVESDYQSGLGLKVNSTPTLFINGEKIANPATYDQLKQLINAKLPPS